MIQENAPTYSLWQHRTVWCLNVVVFLLIFVGGLVTTTDAGMAVPDWPSTYGYNLFLYPWTTWFFGPWDLFIEHAHRLVAALAGLICIALMWITWRVDRRVGVRWFSVALLGLVLAQAFLGGFRVIQDQRVLAKAHGCLGPMFFIAVVAFGVLVSPWYFRKEWNPEDKVAVSRRRRFAHGMLVLCFLQLVVGSFIRHIDVTSSAKGFKHLVYTHLAIAALIFVGSIFYRMWVSNRFWKRQGIRSYATWSLIAVTVQIGLGLMTWLLKFGFPIGFEGWEFANSFLIPEKSLVQTNIVTSHVAIGSLILAFWTVQSMRLRVMSNETLKTRDILAHADRGLSG